MTRPEQLKTPGLPPLLIAGLFVALLASCYGVVWFNGLTADNPPLGAAGAAMQAASLTPFQPEQVQITVGAVDTYPTITHTATPEPITISDNRTNEPAIRYETRVVVQNVTQVVTVLHTRIPAPTSTPEPTPNYQATMVALQVSQAKRTAAWEWLAIGAVSTVAAIFFGVFVFVIGRDLWRKVQAKGALVEQTREEILPVMSPVDGVTLDEYRKIRFMKAQGSTQSEIENEVYGYMGGAAHTKVKMVFADLGSKNVFTNAGW